MVLSYYFLTKAPVLNYDSIIILMRSATYFGKYNPFTKFVLMKQRIDIMGILNLTPDSFYAPSRLLKDNGNPDAEAVVARAQAMVADGATVLDLGACSTRPGFTDVGAEEEWRRLGPVLRPLRDALPDVILSIDTYQPEVVRRVFDAIGPFWVNDVSASLEMVALAARLNLPYIAMHGFIGGTCTPRATYSQVPWNERGASPGEKESEGMTEKVVAFFKEFAEKASQAGLEDWMVDPGFGFGKTLEQNYEVFRDLERLQSFGRRILVGISRKSMIYKLLGCTPDEALPATQALHLAALDRGASILRVHDVLEASRTVAIWRALKNPSVSVSSQHENS